MKYETASLRRKISSVWVASVFALALATVLVVSGFGYSGTENLMILWVNGLSDSLEPLFQIFTLFGSEFVLVPVLIILWYVRRYRTALLAVIAAGGAYVMSLVLKNLVASERPYVVLPDIQQRATELTMAFPSGHTSFAAALVTLLVLEFGGRWKWAASVWICAVAISRIYLGVHSILDVVGGAALGIAVGIGVHVVLPHIRTQTQAFLLAINRRSR